MRKPRDYSHLPMQFLLWLRKSKINKAGTAPIMLRVFLNTTDRAEHSTGIRCRPDQWNAAKGCLRGTDEATRTYNKVLENLVSKATLLTDRMQSEYDATEDASPVRPAGVVAALKPKQKLKEPLLLAVLEQAIPVFYAAKPGTKAGIVQALGYLAKWPGSAKLKPSAFDAATAVEWLAWLGAQGLAATSQRSCVGRLSSLFRRALPQHPRVFERLFANSPESTKPVRPLSLDWLAKLKEVKLSPVATIARDVFFLQFYLHGSRIGAVLALRKDQIDWQEGRVRFATQKVAKRKDVAFREELRALLERYRYTSGPLLLPLLPTSYLSLSLDEQHAAMARARNTVNAGLRRAAKCIGWEGNIHSHQARHSLAFRAFKVSGGLQLPQKLLDHSSMAMTARYIAKMDTSELDAGAASVYDSLI
jgi:integrase